MLVLTAILLALIPAVAIAYPFLRGLGDDELPADDDTPETALELRWDAALSGLKSAELDWTIGRMAEEDYHRLRDLYMSEAALVMKAMELEEQQEREMLESIERERREVHARTSTVRGDAPSGTPGEGRQC